MMRVKAVSPSSAAGSSVMLVISSNTCIGMLTGSPPTRPTVTAGNGVESGDGADATAGATEAAGAPVAGLAGVAVAAGGVAEGACACASAAPGQASATSSVNASSDAINEYNQRLMRAS
ncbi:hypothetical protein GCM10028795_12230 [Lysobacter olei]